MKKTNRPLASYTSLFWRMEHTSIQMSLLSFFFAFIFFSLLQQENIEGRLMVDLLQTWWTIMILSLKGDSGRLIMNGMWDGKGKDLFGEEREKSIIVWEWITSLGESRWISLKKKDWRGLAGLTMHCLQLSRVTNWFLKGHRYIFTEVHRVIHMYFFFSTNVEALPFPYWCLPPAHWVEPSTP